MAQVYQPVGQVCRLEAQALPWAAWGYWLATQALLSQALVFQWVAALVCLLAVRVCPWVVAQVCLSGAAHLWVGGCSWVAVYLLVAGSWWAARLGLARWWLWVRKSRYQPAWGWQYSPGSVYKLQSLGQELLSPGLVSAWVLGTECALRWRWAARFQ